MKLNTKYSIGRTVSVFKRTETWTEVLLPAGQWPLTHGQCYTAMWNQEPEGLSMGQSKPGS